MVGPVGPAVDRGVRRGRVDREGARRGRGVDVARGVLRAHPQRVAALGEAAVACAATCTRTAGRGARAVEAALERRACLGAGERELRRGVVGRAARAGVDRRVRRDRVDGDRAPRRASRRCCRPGRSRGRRSCARRRPAPGGVYGRRAGGEGRGVDAALERRAGLARGQRVGRRRRSDRRRRCRRSSCPARVRVDRDRPSGARGAGVAGRVGRAGRVGVRAVGDRERDRPVAAGRRRRSRAPSRPRAARPCRPASAVPVKVTDEAAIRAFWAGVEIDRRVPARSCRPKIVARGGGVVGVAGRVDRADLERVAAGRQRGRRERRRAARERPRRRRCTRTSRRRLAGAERPRRRRVVGRAGRAARDRRVRRRRVDRERARGGRAGVAGRVGRADLEGVAAAGELVGGERRVARRERAPLSMRHSNVASASAVKVKVGVVSLLGARRAAVDRRRSAPSCRSRTCARRRAPVLPAGSVARTSKVWLPWRERARRERRRCSCANAAASTRHWNVEPASRELKVERRASCRCPGRRGRR